MQPRKRPRQPSRCKLNYRREGSRRSCAPWPVASSLKISSLYLSWIIEVISHVSERKPFVAARRGDSVAYVLSRLDCKTRLAETWLLERREKVFPPTSGHVARGYFTKNRRRAEGEQRGRGEFFRRGGPIDERQTGLPWKSLPRISTYYASEFLILCVPLVARCYDGHESFMRRKRRARVACMPREMEKNILEGRSFELGSTSGAGFVFFSFYFFSFYRRVIEIFRLVGGERADRLFNSVR